MSLHRGLLIVALMAAIGWVSMLMMRPASADGPNVLIVVWDTVRADRMSVYGHDLPTTPKLEAFAQDARVYDRALSPAIWTPPSHASMFTGHPPSKHGVKATYKWLDERYTTLAEWVGVHGYQSYLFSANPYVHHSTNISQGFEIQEFAYEGRWKKASKQATADKLIPADASTDISPLWRPQQGQRTGGHAHAYKESGLIANQAFGTFLDERDETRPFFAYLNYMEAHIPRIPSIKARKALLSDEHIALGLRTDVSQINLLSYIFNHHDYTEDELAAIRGVYDATLLDLDNLFADLMADLEARGLLDDTVVILTSDHGENLGDHHMFGHKFSAWETLLHVPLIIRYPKEMPPGRVETPVSNLALFQTILDLVGLPSPDPTTLSVSLLESEDQQPVVSQMIEATPVAIRRVNELHGGVDMDFWFHTYDAIEEDGFKLVNPSSGDPALYHVEQDPHELEDLADDVPNRVDALRKELDTWHTTFEPYDPSLRAEGDKPRAVEKSTQEMLQALGYLEDH
jgi:arylsulfatase A-like enzyme